MRLFPSVLLTFWAFAAQEHFAMIIPDDAMLSSDEGREIDLTVGFGHPFTPEGLDMAPPQRFFVRTPEGDEDLKTHLVPTDFFGADGFVFDNYRLRRPGTHIFALDPEPYWEPAEDKFIRHLTKTYVAAYDDDEGWDQELGLEVEIVPLTRPVGIWAGNLFQAVVKRNGAAVPFAEVEVEHFNQTGLAEPDPLMVTQTIRADENGMMSFVAPAAGWWGFAALMDADGTILLDGEAKSVELGAVIWVYFQEWPQ